MSEIGHHDIEDQRVVFNVSYSILLSKNGAKKESKFTEKVSEY